VRAVSRKKSRIGSASSATGGSSYKG
jgi:hypothetical protein